MQRDEQLRADARAYYNDQRLWQDMPPFDQAERLVTPAYARAVEVALQDRDRVAEIEFARLQLALI